MSVDNGSIKIFIYYNYLLVVIAKFPCLCYSMLLMVMTDMEYVLAHISPAELATKVCETGTFQNVADDITGQEFAVLSLVGVPKIVDPTTMDANCLRKIGRFAKTLSP